LVNELAFVSGAGSGIGEAIARRLAADGYAVVVGDVDVAAATGVASELPEARTIQVDVRSSTSVADLAAEIARDARPLTAVALSAGIEVQKPFADMLEDDWSLVIETNLTGAFACCRALMPLLVEAGGAVVTVGSPLARLAYPGATAYAASKGGLEAFSRALAVDVAPQGVRVNCLVPGVTSTPMLWATHRGAQKEAEAAAAASVPLGRVATPSEIAEVAAFLLSDRSRYVTGAVIAVDGGLLARLAVDS
jgi:NAD(P)-dependent dehydrogenase (short-subunit alcohol dehydrogenase family)